MAATEHPEQVTKNSSTLRLWHWLNALVICGSLITVLINSTILDTRPTATFIQGQIRDAGATVTDKQARAAAHGLSDKIWTLHTYFGYTLAGLLLFRLILEFFQLADQKLLRKIKTYYHNFNVIKQNRQQYRHNFWVKTTYAVFYLMLLTMVCTGLCLAFEDDIPFLKSIHAFREIHSFTMYLILAFIVVHIAGVFLAERGESPGITSDMINGGKE